MMIPTFLRKKRGDYCNLGTISASNDYFFSFQLGFHSSTLITNLQATFSTLLEMSAAYSLSTRTTGDPVFFTKPFLAFNAGVKVIGGTFGTFGSIIAALFA